MKKSLFILFTLIGLSISLAQNGVSYQFYNKKHKKVTFNKVVNDLSQYDVVLFGEFHDNSINHWLQLQLTKSLYKLKKEKLILGAEMFERDNQEQLDQYLNSEFDTHVLKDSIRLWNNYFTDYHPIIEFAKVNQIKFIATNIPRRYASMVARNGLESLDTIQPYEKKYLMSLPIHIDMQTPGYLEMKNLIGEHAGKSIDNFIAAQAVKDATMAESIIKHHKKGKLFLHFQGNYHSKEYGGIYWYLKKLNPSLKVAVISIFLSKDERLSFPKDEFTPTEFNLVLPEDITKTF